MRPYRGFITCFALLLTLCAAMRTVHAQDCYDYHKTFGAAAPYALPGTVGPMAADQDRALVPVGTTLHVLDLSDPDAISELGTYVLAESPVLLASEDDLAALATSTSLVLLDWNDPSSPAVVQTLAVPAGAVSLKRVGDRLLVSRGAAGVDLYACTVPGGLQFLGNADTPGTALDATIHDGWLVVADVDALLTMDISEPAAPVPADSYTAYGVAAVDRNVSRVDSEGGYLIAASVRWQGGQFGGPTEGLDMMDVGPAGELTGVSDTYFGGDGPAYAFVGGTMHVSYEDRYLLFDLSEFPAPAVTLDLDDATTKPIVAGPHAVLHRFPDNTFDVYDVRYPFYVSPDPAWDGPFFHDIGGGTVVPGFMQKEKTTWSGLFFSYDAYLYDVRDPSAVEEINHYGYSGDYNDFADRTITDHDGDRILVSSSSGFGSASTLYDRSTGATVSTALPYHGDAVFDGTRIYQKTTELDDPVTGVAILDAGTPGAITELGFLSVSAGYKPFVVAANIAVIVDADLNLYDLSDPSAPIELSSVPGVRGSVLAMAGDRLYVNTSVGNLVCVDIADVNAISQVWEVPFLHVRSMSVHGDLAVIERGGFLEMYDLFADPSAPVALSPPFPANGDVYGFLWDGYHVYTDGMHVYDVSDPYAPQLVGRGTDGRGDLYRDGERIVTSRGCFPIQCVPTGVPDDRTLPTPVTPLNLKAAPNPFNPRTNVSFVIPEAGEVRLMLHDLAGRRVRTLLSAWAAAGPHDMVWDGRDEEGRVQASGVYLLRLVAGETKESAKLVLLR